MRIPFFITFSSIPRPYIKILQCTFVFLLINFLAFLFFMGYTF